MTQIIQHKGLTMTRKVSEILNLVANSEYFLPGLSFPNYSSSFMCYSLELAKHSGLITKEEEDVATKAIHEYLRKLCTYAGHRYTKHDTSLQNALYINKLPSTFKYRKAIYLDWANRPKPWKGN